MIEVGQIKLTNTIDRLVDHVHEMARVVIWAEGNDADGLRDEEYLRLKILTGMLPEI